MIVGHEVPKMIRNVALQSYMLSCSPFFDRMPWFDDFVRKYISEGHSLMAVDSSNNDELVGVAILTECRSK